MVKLVAKQPVDATQLPGITLLFEPEQAYIYHRGSNKFRVADNALREGMLLEVGGHGFKHVFSQPTGAGTVTRLKVKLDGQLVYKITNLDVKLDHLFDVDLEKAMKVIFKGSDTFKGSSGNDVFAGRGSRDKLNGKDGADILYGEKGKDRLDGGPGMDTLDGGKHKDTYIFKEVPDGQYDRIVKFQKGETMELSHKAFSALSKGDLSADEFFVVGQGTKDADDHIIYDPASGYVSYDPDGIGPAAALRFALLQPDAKFTADNILVI